MRRAGGAAGLTHRRNAQVIGNKWETYLHLLNHSDTSERWAPAPRAGISRVFAAG